MSRYRKVEVGTWGDRRFRELSPQPPSGQALWLYLLCGPRTTIFPGLVIATPEVIASDLKWPLDPSLNLTGNIRGSFREAWGEVSSKALAKADWNVGLIVLPKALLTRDGEPRESAKPGNTNCFKSWAKSWCDVPECDLKDEYLIRLGDFARALGPSFAKAYVEAWGKGSRKLHPKLSHQEQEQKKDQEQEQERSEARAAGPVIEVGRLAIETWLELGVLRDAIAAELGVAVIPLPLVTPAEPRGFRDLRDRIREEGEHAAAVCALVLANLAKQARSERDLEWLSDKAFTEGGWRWARHYSERKSKDAMNPRARDVFALIDAAEIGGNI